MTYEESYRKCTTIEELEKELKVDIILAQIINPDRLEIIEKSAKKVAIEKFGEGNWSIEYE